MSRNKLEEILNAVKLDELKGIAKVGDLLDKKDDEDKKKLICRVGIIFLGVIVLAVIAFVVYK